MMMMMSGRASGLFDTYSSFTQRFYSRTSGGRRLLWELVTHVHLEKANTPEVAG